MSEVINPPDYYFTGINFNPAFYADDSGGGLSESTANTLYLRKTVPDTATAIETFNLGIKAQKVDGLLSSSTMYVGNNITTGSVILGNLSCRTKSAGIFETASIRAPATNGTVAICGDATAGGGVDIGSANGTVNLLASSSGGVNVPTSLGASSNAVNVGYLTTALVNVATLNQIQTFNQTNTFDNATAGIKANVIAGVATTGTQSLFGTKTAGTLNIANSQTAGGINIGGVGSAFSLLSTGINIGNAGLPASGYIAIAGGTNVTGSYAQFGSDTLPYSYIRAQNLEINTNTAGTTNIGYSTGTATTNVYGQLRVGDLYSTNHIMGVGSNATNFNGIGHKAYNDTNTVFTSFNTGISSRGGIQGVNSTTVSFPTSSDRRLKTNIKPMNPMLDKIMSLKPSEYGWISNDDIGYGFIAQEVHQLFPEMRIGANGCEDIENPCDCETGKPVYYGLDYGKFTPYIVKAVQELKEEYDAKFKVQEEKLSTLEARLLALETKPPHVEVTEPHETVIV